MEPTEHVVRYTDKYGNAKVKVDTVSNKSRAQRPKPNGLQALGEALKKASQEATEQKKRELTEEDSDVDTEHEQVPEDLNILPLPETQQISNSDWIKWEWPIDKGCTIFGILYTKDALDGNNKGDYHVQLSFVGDGSGDPTDVYTFSPETSKAIGMAMNSASNWVNIWKQYAGHFLEKEMFGE